STPQDSAFLNWESDPILTRRIIGKSDVDIAAIIQKLGNSDWVKQGVPFLKSSDGVCPFCQQGVPDQLASSLEEYFDEAFQKDTEALRALENGYKLEGERLQKMLQQLVTSNPRFLDTNRIATEKSVFDARWMLNSQRIAAKVKEPSQIVVMESLVDVLKRVRELVIEANEKITAHNDMVAN